MKKTIAIIGGGAASMALACFIDSKKYNVTIYEKNKALGRKFLVAGKGGFNLTHSLDAKSFKAKYQPPGFLDRAFDSFTNTDFREWLGGIGIPTFVGSSGRVFPVSGIKPIEVFNAILAEIERNGVRIQSNFLWDNNVSADIKVFALGGGSWSITGSDGLWLQHFEGAKTFSPVNCGFKVKWPQSFLDAHEGKPLKNIKLTFDNSSSLGELIVSKSGLEGNAIYALSYKLQKALVKGSSTIFLDLKKDLTQEEVLKKLEYSKEKTVTNSLKRDLRLDKTRIHLLKHFLSKSEYLDPEILSHRIKELGLEVVGTVSLDEAISTIGGIPVGHLDQNFQLKEYENQYCIGEMVDWHAQTGGFLLQGCFSMGYYLAKQLNSNFGA